MEPDEPLFKAVPCFPHSPLTQRASDTLCSGDSFINDVMQRLNNRLSGNPSPGMDVIVDVPLHFLLVE